MPKLKWTKSQKEVAELAKQGKSFTDIVEAGYSKTMASRVMNALKNGNDSKAKQTSTTVGTIHRQPETPETKVRTQTVDPQPISNIYIVPQPWYLTQHGYYLIHDTYKLTQQKFEYGGSIGEFLVDVCQLYRDLLAFPVRPFVYEEPIMEVLPDGRGEETSEGGGVPEEGGGGDHAEVEGEESGYRGEED